MTLAFTYQDKDTYYFPNKKHPTGTDGVLSPSI